MKDASMEEGHTNMITSMHHPIDYPNASQDHEASVLYNNDFLSKNRDGVGIFLKHK